MFADLNNSKEKALVHEDLKSVCIDGILILLISDKHQLYNRKTTELASWDTK